MIRKLYKSGANRKTDGYVEEGKIFDINSTIIEIANSRLFGGYEVYLLNMKRYKH